jgi:transcription-repair coupling factor (superfamily II helicase)
MFEDFQKKFTDVFKASCIYNLTGSSMALFLALHKEPFVMLESTEEKAHELYDDILFFKSIISDSAQSSNILFLPDPNGPEVAGQRADLSLKLKNNDSIVMSKDALNSKIWPSEELHMKAVILKAKSDINRNELENRLINFGYKRVSLVVEHGEFSHKEWLYDIFPSTSNDPLRIEFFGDTIETIRIFEISTQKSISSISDFTILPASEHSDGICVSEIIGSRNYFYSESVIPMADLPEDASALSKFSFLPQSISDKDASVDAGTLSLNGFKILYNERKDVYEFSDAVKKILNGNKVIIAASSKGQSERIKEILWEKEVVAPFVPKEEIKQYDGNILITTGQLSSGFFLPGLIFLTDKEIFGERPQFRPIKKSKVSELLTAIDDLKIGDFIVHNDHGIGKFAGLEKHSSEGYEGDLMVIEYSGGDRLYLPLYGIEKIKKYHAEEDAVPRIDSLGGATWNRTKERVRKKIKEMAEKLMKLYAERHVAKGFSFSQDAELHKEFYDFFFYEETPDQLRAIEEIKADMESEKPMDRLLCGDVGYGKTEVAMRAAFKVVYDTKQVVLLAPTTLLCDQHYRTFKQRFAAFPVTIDYLSRFKPKKAQTETIKKVLQGNIDILISTHTLLRKNIDFNDLGLLIIDEEHRFGVGQKEKIKEIKKGIDVLTLSATPIPRTLNMALSGIRGMSLIETPPEERLAVKSIVSEFNEQMIKDAITRELVRKGQVYFVHNRINDIDKIFKFVQRIMPDARISIAHGRMSEKHLEKVMESFVNGNVDILVSTSIIGSGLDIPNANTIIIDMADKIGLADLYQLKGRVGRSNVRAYAYFLFPGKEIITNHAKKRLQAVQEMSYLGAGFRLAMKDLEIRGAGNMLGSEQSGHIYAVGFNMYIEMLENAVSELKGIRVEEEIEPKISLGVSAFIPEEFIEDITLRLSIYRKIASAKNDSDLELLIDEIRDRFGILPMEVKNLFDIMRLKILAKQLMITAISDSNKNVRVFFSKNTKVKAEKILSLYNIFGNKVRFLEEGFEIKTKNLAWSETYKLTKETLAKLF